MAVSAQDLGKRQEVKDDGNGHKSKRHLVPIEGSQVAESGNGNGHKICPEGSLIALRDYDEDSDEQICQWARKGDSGAVEYLMKKYEYLVDWKARSYFFHGADHEDVVQEGRIGLFKAVRDYRSSRLCSFRSFAILCITRQIITGVKTATRKKHTPLNSYASLNANVFDEDQSSTLLDVMTSSRAEDPLDLYIIKDDTENIKRVMREVLSDLEYAALQGYIEGKSYERIAEELGKHSKVIDNALYRVKLKLRELLN